MRRASTEMLPMQSPSPGACLLIDDAGRTRRWPGADRGTALGYADPDFDFVDYAVRNLGHVMIEERASFIRIKLRPIFVGRRTRETLWAHLERRAPRRVGLSVFDDAWHHTLLPPAAALQQLREVLDAPERAPPARPFIAARRNIAGLLDDARDPFAPVLRRWLDGTCPDDLPSFLVATGLYDRAMVVERRGDNGDFLFRHSGRRIQLYEPSWAEAALGRRLQDQPDRLYGEWIADACRSVDDRQVPRYDLIAARVSEADQAARSWRYERLMLPWRSAAGQRLVVSISRRENAVRG
jgi:hypothetical protein